MNQRDQIWSGTAASLAFYVYEVLITFGDEVEYIWRKPHTAWIKWAFLFMRYFSLFTQIINFTLFAKFENSTLAHDDPIRQWYTFQSVVGWLLMTVVEAILMSRVYALYIRNRYIACTFIFLLVCEATAMVVGTAHMVLQKADQHDFLHMLIAAPEAFRYLGFVAIFSQVVVLLLTVARYRHAVLAEKSLAVQATPNNSLARAPVMLLTIRDGTYAFAVLFLMSVLTVTYTSVPDLKIYAALIYTWLLVTISSAGCRLIINMQTLPTDYRSTDGHTESIDGHQVELTTLGPDLMSRRTGADTTPFIGTNFTDFDIT